MIYIQIFSSYRAVKFLCLGYPNQSFNTREIIAVGFENNKNRGVGPTTPRGKVLLEKLIVPQLITKYTYFIIIITITFRKD
jgi:hypothetical protein